MSETIEIILQDTGKNYVVRHAGQKFEINDLRALYRWLYSWSVCTSAIIPGLSTYIGNPEEFQKMLEEANLLRPFHA